MGDRGSQAESGFLTASDSRCPTPSEMLESCYDSDELMNNLQNNLMQSNYRLPCAYVSHVGEQLADSRGQFHYCSAPNIPESYRMNKWSVPEIYEAGTTREASPEQRRCLDTSGETGDSERKRSFWKPSVKILLWLTIGSCVITFIAVAVLLGCLLPRDAGKGLSSRGCPCEESRNWVGVGGRCYYFSEDRTTWNESREFCTTHDSMLAVLMELDIKETIDRYRESADYWIGLSMKHNGNWMWTNGSRYDGSLDDHSGRLRCAFLNSHLGALDCSTRRQWICVKDYT